MASNQFFAFWTVFVVLLSPASLLFLLSLNMLTHCAECDAGVSPHWCLGLWITWLAHHIMCACGALHHTQLSVTLELHRGLLFHWLQLLPTSDVFWWLSVAVLGHITGGEESEHRTVVDNMWSSSSKSWSHEEWWCWTCRGRHTETNHYSQGVGESRKEPMQTSKQKDQTGNDNLRVALLCLYILKRNLVKWIFFKNTLYALSISFLSISFCFFYWN